MRTIIAAGERGRGHAKLLGRWRRQRAARTEAEWVAGGGGRAPRAAEAEAEQVAGSGGARSGSRWQRRRQKALFGAAAARDGDASFVSSHHNRRADHAYSSSSSMRAMAASIGEDGGKRRKLGTKRAVAAGALAIASSFEAAFHICPAFAAAGACSWRPSRLDRALAPPHGAGSDDALGAMLSAGVFDSVLRDALRVAHCFNRSLANLLQRPRRRRPARDWAPPLPGPGDALDVSSRRTRLAESPPSPRYARDHDHERLREVQADDKFYNKNDIYHLSGTVNLLKIVS
uniref:Uncharacterized protein n=1 Tax=Oryza meridionalis TaxID=40149 RepID=A0A0E0FAE6_9ORYZ